MTITKFDVIMLDIASKPIPVPNANIVFNYTTGSVEWSNYYGIAQGSLSGYAAGGGSPPSYSNIIEKFPFSTDANATDVGNLTVARFRPAGQSSLVSGYTSGGLKSTPAPTYSDVIDKFPFSTDTNATDVGNLTQNRYAIAGQSSTESGYSSGGVPFSNIIDKFPFAADANATDVGDLTGGATGLAGQSSKTNGYVSGIIPPSTSINIEKFPFATDSNSTEVGYLTQSRTSAAGQSSSESGYTSAGSPVLNTIDKFPFATDANATDVGDLTVSRREISGQSSTISGYSSGGFPLRDVIDKFPFYTDSNATDVGNLTQGRNGPTGQQV